MLARAEPDLKVERAVLAEQALSGDLALVGNLDLGKQLVEQRLLLLRSLCPLDRP